MRLAGLEMTMEHLRGKMKISELLKLWRIKHGMTQEQAAHELGVVVKTFHNWETGKTAPPDYIRKAIEK